MNTSNITNVTTEDKVYAGIFSLIMVIGLPLNAISLWILLRRHSLKSPNAVFMVNLALSDLLLVFTLPMRIHFHTTGEWTLPKGVCLIITMFFRTNIRSSASFITFISVDRLLAVVYPLRSHHLWTSCNAWKGAALIWGVFLQIVLLVTMLAVNIVCTIMVCWTLHNHLSDSAAVDPKENHTKRKSLQPTRCCTKESVKTTHHLRSQGHWYVLRSPRTGGAILSLVEDHTSTSLRNAGTKQPAALWLSYDLLLPISPSQSVSIYCCFALNAWEE